MKFFDLFCCALHADAGVGKELMAINSILLCLPAGNGDQSLAEMALRVGSPRAPWDPLVLRGLLLRGRRAAAVAALRQLLARLQFRVRCGFLWDVHVSPVIQVGTGEGCKIKCVSPTCITHTVVSENLSVYLVMRSTSGRTVCGC